MTEDEMIGWLHPLSRHEFEQALGVDDGQGSLACCNPGDHKSRTQLSDWTEMNRISCILKLFYMAFKNSD